MLVLRQPTFQSLTVCDCLLPLCAVVCSLRLPTPQDPAQPSHTSTSRFLRSGRAHLHPASMPCYPSAKKRLANPHAPLDLPSFPRVGTTPRYLPSFNIHPNQPPRPLDVPPEE